MRLTFADLRALNHGQARTDVACPVCGPTRQRAASRKRKTLRIWDHGEFISYKCVRCEEKGWARDDRTSPAATPRRPVKPAPVEEDKSEFAQFLWRAAMPMQGSPVEVYLAARKCPLVTPVLRYLPARKDRPHAMLARFCDTGVHLTYLRSAGTGKADIEKPKIMIGPSQGHPIELVTTDGSTLVITEGIEDAASIAIVTGWNAWAAGSAGRIAKVVPKAHGFERVYIAFDNDPSWRTQNGVTKRGAGPEAFDQAKMVRPDVVPLNIAKALGKDVDPNTALQLYGPDVLMAAIEWCDARHAYTLGMIGFNAMLRQIGRAEGVFGALIYEDAHAVWHHTRASSPCRPRGWSSPIIPKDSEASQ